MFFDHQKYGDSIVDLLKKLGIPSRDASLYKLAFVHRSALNEYKGAFKEHNERLEFLGDAVLELVMTDLLYETFPDKAEGWMTDVRSSVVRGKNLSSISKELGFDEYILLSKGEKSAGGDSNPALLADAFEAFLGAMYLDLGFDFAKNFIREHVYSTLESILEQNLHIDPKSALQELTQSQNGLIPEYKVAEETGLDHEKQFTIDVYVDGKKVGSGIGSSKKKAQESAAQNALKNSKTWIK